MSNPNEMMGHESVPESPSQYLVAAPLEPLDALVRMRDILQRVHAYDDRVRVVRALLDFSKIKVDDI